MKVTILTPTYNRAYILPKLYESLKKQTETNFEWMIIDDGSSDNTEDLITKFKKENKINIKYFKQKNGGKHRALNHGINKIKTELTMIVDSDDYLTEDAIKTINKYYNKYKDREYICGFSFLKEYPDSKLIGEKFPKDIYITDYISCRINENIVGDKAEVFFTKILNEFPFLEIPNEKFLFEDYVWLQLGNKYKTIHINESIYVADYLSDGLTKNMTKIKLSSPIGMSKRGHMLCLPKCNMKTRLKGIMLYIAYGLVGKEKITKLYFQCKYKVLYVMMTIPSLLYYIILLYKKGRKKL